MSSSLPDVLWDVIIIGAIVTILFAILHGAEKLWIHALATSLLVIIIAMTIFLIIELDYPFMGEISARPASYEGILESIGDRIAD
jgi:hypothetical protein